jgi:NAD(P)-dependent dehydrogenase (short-subunit alcohol dehydrogenase family)
LLNVSSFSIYDFEVNKETPSYGISKNAAALLMQSIAQEVPASDMQVLSFHPGFIYTHSARMLGFGDDLSHYYHGEHKIHNSSGQTDFTLYGG